MELDIPWEASSCAATKKFSQNVIEPEGSLPCSQRPEARGKGPNTTLFKTTMLVLSHGPSLLKQLPFGNGFYLYLYEGEKV
jgi:hypothetical protein